MGGKSTSVNQSGNKALWWIEKLVNTINQMKDVRRSTMRRAVEAINIKGERSEKRHQITENKLRGSKAVIRSKMGKVRYEVSAEVRRFRKNHEEELQKMREINRSLREQNSGMMKVFEVMLTSLGKVTKWAVKTVETDNVKGVKGKAGMV